MTAVVVAARRWWWRRHGGGDGSVTVTVVVTAGVHPGTVCSLHRQGTAARHSTQVSTAAHGSSTAAHHSTGQQDGTGQQQQWRVAGVQRHSSTSQRGGKSAAQHKSAAAAPQVGRHTAQVAAHSTSRLKQARRVNYTTITHYSSIAVNWGAGYRAVIKSALTILHQVGSQQTVS